MRWRSEDDDMPRLTTTFGRTWWSQRWLRPLDELDPEFDGRLARGRVLARDGGVLQLCVEPGLILATVKGSYWERHDVAIQVPTLADSVWARVIDELTQDTLTVATLLAGEMPTRIEATFARAAAPLFVEMDELAAECACADSYHPCRHILATMYAMAARLDQEPLLLFELRGRSSAALLSALRRQWAGEEDIAPETHDSLPELRADRYFGQIPLLDDFTVNYEEPEEDTAILRRLGQPAFAREGDDVVTALTPVYQAITRHALKAVAQQRNTRNPRKSSPEAPSSAVIPDRSQPS
jgi:uncharacterized Zn finger protein